MGTVLLGLGTGAYAYYQTSQSKIRALEAENVLYSSANETLEKTLDEVREQHEISQRNAEELSRSLTEVERQNSELRKIFLEHDLTDLAMKKPGLIESRINEGTKSVFDDIERITSE